MDRPKKEDYLTTNQMEHHTRLNEYHTQLEKYADHLESQFNAIQSAPSYLEYLETISYKKNKGGLVGVEAPSNLSLRLITDYVEKYFVLLNNKDAVDQRQYETSALNSSGQTFSMDITLEDSTLHQPPSKSND